MMKSCVTIKSTGHAHLYRRILYFLPRPWFSAVLLDVFEVMYLLGNILSIKYPLTVIMSTMIRNVLIIIVLLR